MRQPGRTWIPTSLARALPAAILILFPFGTEGTTLSSLILKPRSVVNGVSSIATVTLDSAAPAGGANVILTNHNPGAATVPGSVTVPEGSPSAFFLISTNAVASSSQVVVDASFGGVSQTATLTVTPRVPLRGTEGDLWADVILGKPDFSEIGPYEVVPYKAFNPGGVYVDRSVAPGRAYVWDSGNSRILGINLATCYAGATPCAPQVVIGQPSGTDHAACNGDSGFQHFPTRAPASAASLCGVPEAARSPLEWKSFVTMASDAQGSLYVPDAFNNRVLKYLNPFTSNKVADEVWGQANFSGNLCNRGAATTASSLCFTIDDFSAGGVAIDSSGNLWVADNGNHRVLRFPKNSANGVIAKTANLVLGQPDLVSHGYGPGPSELNSPSSLRFGPDGRLYVADTGNQRVLVFTPNPSFSTGMAGAPFGFQFAAPYGLETNPDSVGGGLWVNDRDNSMIELWDWNGTGVQKVLGKDTFQPDQQCGTGLLCYSGGGIGVDTEGSVLAPLYTDQDVLRFQGPIPDPLPGFVYQPDRRLFSPPAGYNFSGGKGLRSGGGIAFHGDQVLVADVARVVFWNDRHTLTNGKPFDGSVGGGDLVNSECCSYLRTDAQDRLWVQGNLAGLSVYSLPLTDGEPPLASRVLLPNTTLPVVGGGSLTIGKIEGIAPYPEGDLLWVSDTSNNRVLRIRDPLGSPIVDVVLGQTDAAGNLCNRGLIPPPNQGTNLVADATMICHPGALAFDRHGNLFVSDHGPEVEGNWRLLMFDAFLFPFSPQPSYDVPATKIFPYRGGQAAITFDPAFDSGNRMVVGYNSYIGGNFVGVYSDPTGPSTDPDTYLNDFQSWPTAIAFDADDNLYVGDANRSRVLVYRKPITRSQYSLTVTRSGKGTGTVTSSPVGISCGGTCTKAFPTGTSVALSAAAAASSFFAGWSGDADCSGGAVTMIWDKACTARFDLLPDLTVSALTAPAGALAGSTIAVTDTTANQIGAGPAAASTTKLYLSTNATWDAADTLLGSRPVPGLAPGGTSAGPTNLTIPPGTPTGTYYIIARADAGGALIESVETNNTRAIAIRVSPPDLIVSALSVPTKGGSSLSMDATSTTRNQGNTGPAAASTTKFYISTNATWDAQDTLIGSQDIGPLAPGAFEVHTTTLQIPAGFGPGTFYVIAKADAAGQIPETNENNNTLSDTTVIGPDLIVSDLVAPSTATASSITITDTTKNQGGGQAAASVTRFYLSTNAAWDVNDAFLGGIAVGPLDPGATFTDESTLPIPSSTPPGTYYILARADAGSSVAETSETNNVTSRVIRINP